MIDQDLDKSLREGNILDRLRSLTHYIAKFTTEPTALGETADLAHDEIKRLQKQITEQGKLVEAQGEYIAILEDDLRVYDPSWFSDDPEDIGDTLRACIEELRKERV